MRFRFLSTAMRETMLLIFFCGVFLCAIRHMAFAGRVLYDWNQPGDSGHSWQGWTWKEDAAYGRHGWWKNDGSFFMDKWLPRTNPKTNDGSVTDAIITRSERAPSTNEGASIEIFDTGASTAYQPSWWLFLMDDNLGNKGITNASTDRWDFYIKVQSINFNESGSGDIDINFHVGTYLCWDDGNPNTTGCPKEGPYNLHYYHYLSLNDGAWLHVVLDQHPSHLRGHSGNIPNNPSFVNYGKNYYENLVISYFEIRNPQPAATKFWLDEVRFYSTQETQEPDQNDISIASVWVGYWPNGDYWEISWSDCSFENWSNYTNSTFEVRWSTSPITNENWDQANPITPMFYRVGDHLVRRASSWKNTIWTRFALPDEIEKNYNVIYFAIKDVSVQGGHIGTWPYNEGDGHDTPSGYIHTIDYYLRPDPSTGNRPPTAPRNLSVE